jgi:hypothetical protein
MRRRLLPLLALLLPACTNDPSGGGYLLGLGDPVRGAALNAPAMLGDTSRWAGNPAGAARAAVQLEFLAEAFQNDPRYAPEASGAVQHSLRLGRAEMRQAIGIAPDAPAEPVMGQLREAAAALDGGSQARAEAALSGPMFPGGGVATLARLGVLPRLARVSEAAGAVNAELRRMSNQPRNGSSR